MRVLHVIPSIAPRYGGPSRAVVGFCAALIETGADAVIATTNADGAGVLPVPLGQLAEYERVPAIFFGRLEERFKYSPALARWLREHVATFDVVHIHAVYSHSSIAAGRACRRAGVPYVLRPLGSLAPWALGQSVWKKRVLEVTAVRALIAGAAAIHFMTEEEQRLARSVTGNVQAAVVPPGVDRDLLSVPLRSAAERDLRMSTLSRLDPSKRLDVLIDAFHQATTADDIRPWRLAIAGDGDAQHRRYLGGVASAGSASDRIEFTGWIDGEAKRDWLSRSAVFAVPSHQENFGIGLLEALACGVPAIMSPGVNLARAVVEAGAGWVFDDHAELPQLLARVLRDTDGRERASRAARDFAGRFSWRETSARLMTMYADARHAPAKAAS